MASQQERSFATTLLPIWFLLPLVGVIIAATLEPIPPHDYWWHLVMGREIASTGVVPSSNLFLYTLPQSLPFVDQPWLAQWILYQVHGAAGYAGGVLLRNFLVVMSWGVALHAMWKRAPNPMVVGATALVLILLTVPVLTVRTRIFAFVPFAILLWSIFGAAEDPKRAKWLFLNVVSTAFWVNVHGTFILAPVLLSAATLSIIAERVLRTREHSWRELGIWMSATAATVLSVALSPSGLGVYDYVLLLSVRSNVSSSVSEWRPPSIDEPIGQFFLVVLCISVVLLALKRKNVRIFEALVFAAGVVLASSAVRSMFWFAMASAVVLVPHIATLVPRQTSEARRLNTFILVVFLAVGLMVQPGLLHGFAVENSTLGLARRGGDGALYLGYENATGAASAIKARLPNERIFHDQTLGGLLEWTLADQGPRQVAFVDQRMEMITDDVWADYFQVLTGDEWRAVLNRWEVNVIIVRCDEQWPLVQRLSADSQWVGVYADEVHLVFVRRGEALTRWRSTPT